MKKKLFNWKIVENIKKIIKDSLIVFRVELNN